jgi:hypothetical protein
MRLWCDCISHRVLGLILQCGDLAPPPASRRQQRDFVQPPSVVNFVWPSHERPGRRNQGATTQEPHENEVLAIPDDIRGRSE